MHIFISIALVLVGSLARADSLNEQILNVEEKIEQFETFLKSESAGDFVKIKTRALDTHSDAVTEALIKLNSSLEQFVIDGSSMPNPYYPLAVQDVDSITTLYGLIDTNYVNRVGVAGWQELLVDLTKNSNYFRITYPTLVSTDHFFVSHNEIDELGQRLKQLRKKMRLLRTLVSS